MVAAVADEEITADSTIIEAATGAAAAAEDPEVVASEVAGTAHHSMVITVITGDTTEVAGMDHQVIISIKKRSQNNILSIWTTGRIWRTSRRLRRS